MYAYMYFPQIISFRAAVGRIWIFRISLHYVRLQFVSEMTATRVKRNLENSYFSTWFKEMSVFFLGSWEMNRSAEQTHRVNRDIYNVSIKDPF